MNRIDLFVKILVFVKILSQWRRKEEEFRSLEVRGKLIALKNKKKSLPTKLMPKLPARVEIRKSGICMAGALLKALIRRSRSCEGVDPSKRK